MIRPQKPKPMFRSFVLADLFTLANASCGMAAIFLCLHRTAGSHDPYFWIVFLLLPLALICDILDGFIARRLASYSALGADLDSLADVVSFGVAPAVLGFTLGLRSPGDALILVYFVVCGISRLARFNVTTLFLRMNARFKNRVDLAMGQRQHDRAEVRSPKPQCDRQGLKKIISIRNAA